MDIKKIREEYRKTLKSEDTEETFDLIFYRPIGFFWAILAKKLGISPNTITIASIFIGIVAGICFYYNNFWINLTGALLLMWADSFDSADGQLARMTKQYSRLGRILDGLSGDFWFVAIYAAICLRENVTSEFFMAHTWLIWVIAAITGVCHGIQAGMADYYRQFHLYFLKGEEGSELDTTAELKKKLQTLSWSENFWQKLTLTFYTNYTYSQEKRTPRMQKLRKALNEKYHGKIPADFRAGFRELSKPLMKYTNILSFNTRTFALFAAILIFRMPWLYFAFELVVLNGILIYMMIRHERICTILRKEIES
ncbi:MAG: CDP-alcohol phosphatidyltransferase family protein [Clostridium sp.]|nr:CDP-alcohol phosphatidyltransferase family protein [Prevotella sp.]MCM1428412.1 CDP-alcohol phosphatidyltransferase family protein [Clostridium sp.]MCM1476257.1 CDP-alcohol phosphatidyltransferase family protein [Muribaculaceae bacterium]